MPCFSSIKAMDCAVSNVGSPLPPLLMQLGQRSLELIGKPGIVHHQAVGLVAKHGGAGNTVIAVALRGSSPFPLRNVDFRAVDSDRAVDRARSWRRCLSVQYRIKV